jgi:hypothetical protein
MKTRGSSLISVFTQPRWLLRGEGAVLFVASCAAFALLGGNWWLFVLLLLAPDLSALGYLLNARVGAACYNAVHTDALPVALLAAGYFTQHPLLIMFALIWLAHLGMDQLAGFGLKYPTKFQDTHLQRV